jgi:hypothetical protein
MTLEANRILSEIKIISIIFGLLKTEDGWPGLAGWGGKKKSPGLMA